MAKTIVGLFEQASQGDPVVREILRGCGCRMEDVASITGGALAVLADIGLPEAQAQVFAEGLKRGGSLIAVQAMTDEAAVCVAALLRRHGALEVAIPMQAVDADGPPGSRYVGPDRRRGAPGDYTGVDRRVLH